MSNESSQPPTSDEKLLGLAQRIADARAWPEEEETLDMSSAEAEQLLVIAKLANIQGGGDPAGSDESDSQMLTRPFHTEKRWGHLELIEQVGSGGFGDVYRAWDPNLEREVALKLVNAERSGDDADALLNEGKLLAQVRHPNVVTVYGAQRIGDVVGIWSEFLHGRTLSQIVRQDGPLSSVEAAIIGVGLAQALSAVHAKGLLHRDIKANNVIRENGGRIVLLDFGAGRNIADVGNDLLGTPLYMAPELYEGHPASVGSDTYSLGVLLYFLVTGEYPVRAGSYLELRELHSRGDRKHLRDVRPDLPQSYVQVVEKMIDADPAERYGSDGQIEAALATSIGLGEPTGAETAAVRRPGLRRWLLPAVALLVLLAAYLVPNVFFSELADVDPDSITPSISIVPFQNLTGNPASEHLAAGLSEMVHTQLASIPNLAVSRSTPGELNDGGARRSVEGSVMQSGEQLQVTLRIVDSDSGGSSWSRTLKAEQADFFSLQGQVVDALAEGLRRRNLVTAAQLVSLRERLDELPTDNPEAFDAWSRGRALLDQTDVVELDEAQRLFERAVALDPEFALAHAGLSRCWWLRYRRTQEEEFASKAYDQIYEAVRLNPDLPTVRLELANTLARTGRNEEALHELSRLLEQQPAYVEALRLRGSILSRQGDHELAIVAYRQALEIRPKDSRTYASLGTLYYDMRKFDAAADVFREAAALERTAPSYSRLATALQAAGRTDDAKEFYLQSLAVEERYEVIANLATLDFSEGRYGEAADRYRRAIELEPRKPGGFRNLGDTQRLLGQHKEARASYLQAAEILESRLRVNPNDVDALSYQALCFAKAGEEESANQKLAMTLDSPRIDVALRRAAIYALTRQPEKSIAELKRIVDQGDSVKHTLDDYDYQSLWKDPRFQQLTGS